MNQAEGRAAAIVVDILKIIPALAFAEIAGLIAFIAKRDGFLLNQWTFSIAFLGLVVAAFFSLFGLSLFIQPLSEDKNPIHGRGIRLCTMAAFWALLLSSGAGAYSVAATLTTIPEHQSVR